MAMKVRESVPAAPATAIVKEQPAEPAVAVPAPPRTSAVRLLLVTALAIVLLTAAIAYGIKTTFAAGEVDYGTMVDGVREFQIEGPQWHFEPRVIGVNPGDSIRIVLTSPDVTHGFAINELGINVPYSPGDGGLVELVIPADTPEGVYTMYCSIFCGSGHSHMKGNIVIGDADTSSGGVLPYAATALMAVIFVGFAVVIRRGAR